MWFSIAVILTVATLGVRAQDPGITSSTGCVCVPYNLCYINNTIITDGSGALVQRNSAGEFDECICPSPERPEGQQCASGSYVCCGLPHNTGIISTTEKPVVTENPVEETLTWDDCGIRGFSGALVAEKVIANGDDSATFPSEFPWMARLLRRSDNTMFCAGSILSSHVIMTAAHCVNRFVATDVLVQVGIWNINLTPGSQTVEVERIFKNDKFGGRNFWNDIALLVVQQKLERSSKVASICLPEPDTTYDNMRCIASGWGVEKFGQQNFSETLRKVELDIVPHAQCQNELRKTRVGPWFELHNSLVCAKGENNGDTCYGDGGGPLVCQQQGSDKYVQVGIVSTGVECGTGAPALYANVPHLMPWIQNKFEDWNLDSLE